IFFWVARMMMMGLEFMGSEPFHTVYVHALVRDKNGAKMSKSKGNVIDPLELIEEYGADALRFTMAALATQGRDVKPSRAIIEGYRNFATKLWNAARFAEMNECVSVEGFNPKTAQLTLNRWIAHETAKVAREVTEALEAFKFNEAAAVVYRFVWNVYCDWYVELAKPLLAGSDGPQKDETRAMTAWARDEICKLLHPFMPFITEELWQIRPEGGEHAPHKGRPGAADNNRDRLLMLEQWPLHPGLEDTAAEVEIGWLIDLITAIRSIRMEINVPPGAQIPLVLVGVDPATQGRAERWADFIKRLARVSSIDFDNVAPPNAVQLVVRGEIAALPLTGVIDLAAERGRLEKEMTKVVADIARVDAKLSNPDFLNRAPEEVVEGEREKREDAEARRAKITEALERLQGAT
ncbi:MAG TPA: class I tRNA ligase family protein, partial [Xanthobacteraceae bacterium]|nr:class I tRNA ligase family protein [Xanthobacteraceae bacterium]